jgi:hemolysin III
MSADNCRSSLCATHREEVANAVTHAAGLAFSVCALIGMLWLSLGDGVRLVSAAVFGVSLVMLYLSSTLYHIATTPRWKAFYQFLDHACIYLLIAGSYTPLTLVALRGAWGWSLFGAVWFMALAGIAIKAVCRGRKDHWISTIFYVAMGWLAVVALGPMWRALPLPGLMWLVAGGLCYTGGVVFFVWERLLYHHAIWHVCVLAGSICHVIAVSLYILR